MLAAAVLALRLQAAVMATTMQAVSVRDCRPRYRAIAGPDGNDETT